MAKFRFIAPRRGNNQVIMAGRGQQKSALAGRRYRNLQHGAALLIFMILVVMGALTYLVSSLTPEMLEAKWAQKTNDALVQAREALIGYALQYREEQISHGQFDRVYGYLPLPDLGTLTNNNAGCTEEGCDASNFAGNGLNHTVIGRLPWRILQAGPLRDGSQQCLWYVVAGSHQREQRAAPMNWDTPGHLDLIKLDASGNPVAEGLTGHDLPVAIIIAPGNRLNSAASTNTGNIDQCQGDYTPGNYLEFTTLGAFNSTTTNHGATSDASVKPIATRGKVVFNTNLLANDFALPITADTLFSAIRKHAYFRQDINSLLDNIASYLGDNPPGAFGKIADNAAYGDTANPQGYYSNYQDMIFVAGGATTVNGNTCSSGALLFAGQRAAGQLRDTVGRRIDFSNYLEGINFGGTEFSGPEKFERVSAMQSASQDIVRCLQPAFIPTQSAALAAASQPQLTSYSGVTQTLTLGRTVSTALPTAVGSYMYGCAWKPEIHAMGGGLRSYFQFFINDTGFSSAPTEGFSFAIVDGDNNGFDACGAAAQHIGYSGNNLESPFIVPPKIAFEIDPRREGIFNPMATNTLLNGRNDPAYTGGHVAIAYWGGDTQIATGTLAPCTSPHVEIGSACYLQPEQDDNVHDQVASTRTKFPAPPANPVAPATAPSVPPDTPQGVYKLDPSLSQVPTNRDFHVRVELTRQPVSYSLLQVRVATTADLDLGAPGSSIDNVPLFAGDRILVKNQTLPADNGLYVWNDAAAPMTRTTDADTAGELAGLVVEVTQGLRNARSLWRQSITNFTLGSDALRWTNLNVKLLAPATTSLTSPGVRLDGILMNVGDRVLIDNTGVYVWNGATVSMTAATDIVAGSIVQVQQGSYATSSWRYDGSSWTSNTTARIAALGNLVITNPIDPGDPTGVSIDGVTMVAGDRILLKSQTVAGQNGIYIWNGVGVAMVRATDADSAAKLAGGMVQVLEGSDSGRTFRQTALTASGTLEIDPVAWSTIDGSPKYTLEIWILPDSGTTANQIIAMKNTTRPMSLLYPSFTAHLRNEPVIPYPFRNVRLGFTIGQRISVTDQYITVSNSATTWID